MERHTGRNEKGDLILCGEQVYGNNQNLYNAISELEDYEKTGLAPEEINALKSERDALTERCGGTIPVHCSDCELWGSNGWSQHGVGYCEGDDKPHCGDDFCSYGKKKEAPDAES